MFANVAAALRPGGLFLYKDISAADRPRAFMNRLHDLILAREWVRYFPREDLRRMARDQGLEERAFTKVNRYWYGHDIHIFARNP